MEREKRYIALLFFTIFCGSFLRLYNLDFDDLYFDEILSFVYASDNLTFSQSYSSSSKLDATPYLFNFFLKIIFHIFSYETLIGKLFLAILSVLSILSVTYLSFLINKNKSYLLTAFLISFNIYLISHTSDLRVYILFFLLSSLSLVFFVKLIKNENKINNLVLFLVFTLLTIFSHPFGIILFFSYIFYVGLIFINNKKIFKILNLTFGIILIFTFFYYFIYFNHNQQVGEGSNWIVQPDLSFYTNFFFSKFFGSRIMGILFLLSLVYLIYKNIKSILKIDTNTLLLIVILFSYFLPLVNGFIIEPILIPRYIIFVLVPIIVIISSLIFNLKNHLIKKFFIILLFILTLGNLFTEQTIKQFYNDRMPHKPEYTKAVLKIEKSGYRKYFVKVSQKDLISKTNEVEGVVKSYIDYLNKKNKTKIIFNKLNNFEKGNIWMICENTINVNCSVKIKDKYKLIEEVDFNRLNLKLIEII